MKFTKKRLTEATIGDVVKAIVFLHILRGLDKSFSRATVGFTNINENGVKQWRWTRGHNG
ncbi:MAG: hypothetical protein ABWY25_06290 [Paenisporosarcina sp.]